MSIFDVSGPVTHLVRWVAPVTPPKPTDEHYASLEQENQQLRTQVFAQTQENQRLRDQLAQLRVVVPSSTGKAIDRVSSANST